MNPVELIPVQGSLVLRARGSELLILPQYIYELKKLSAPKEFAGYFMQQALINRPARKLFEAWLRKDRSLWKRTYNVVMNDIELDEETIKAIESAPLVGEEEVKEEPKKEAKKAEAKPAKKKAEAKPAKKKTAKKAEAKPAKKKAAKKAATKTAAKKKTAKKAATKKAATKKKTAKKATKK
mgnify:CR=1 FL=1